MGRAKSCSTILDGCRNKRRELPIAHGGREFFNNVYDFSNTIGGISAKVQIVFEFSNTIAGISAKVRIIFEFSNTIAGISAKVQIVFEFSNTKPFGTFGSLIGRRRKDMTTEQLVQAARQGDDEAFFLLVNSEKERLYRIAYAYLKNEAESSGGVAGNDLPCLRETSEAEGAALFSYLADTHPDSLLHRRTQTKK